MGLAGEALAARFLKRAGYRVLSRRLLTREAEIDLLCSRGAELVCVEVKTGRIGTRFRPGMRVKYRTLRRLWAAARGLERRYAQRARVDLVEVGTGETLRFVHHVGLREPLKEPR